MQSFAVNKHFVLKKPSQSDSFHGMKYRNRLRVLRAGKGLSQLDTSLKANIKHYRYWRIENGYEIPTEQERTRLAKVLGVDTDHLESAAIAS